MRSINELKDTDEQVLQDLSERLRFVRYVLVGAAVLDALIFVTVGIEYTAWCFIVSALVLTKLETSKPDEIMNTYFLLPTALYLVLGIVFIHSVIWPPLELTFLRLATEPLRFLWFKAYIGPITLLGWLIYYFRRPAVLKPLLDLNPGARKFFLPKTARKYTLMQIGFAMVWLLGGFPAHFILMSNSAFVDRAKDKAAAQMKSASEAKYQYFVESLSADNAANPSKVWGRVSVFDGETLRSVPVEWSER
jgi:hypothetical protein